jgi:hypothetical protein
LSSASDITGAFVTLLGPQLTTDGVEWVWTIESHLDDDGRLLPAGPVTASLPFGLTIVADRIAPEVVYGVVVRTGDAGDRPAPPAPEAAAIVARLYGTTVREALNPGPRLLHEPLWLAATADSNAHRRAGHLALACQRSSELDRSGSTASIWSAQMAADSYGLGAEFEDWARGHALRGANAIRLLPVPRGLTDGTPGDESWRPFRIAVEILRGQVNALLDGADLGPLPDLVQATSGRIKVDDEIAESMLDELATSLGSDWREEVLTSNVPRGSDGQMGERDVSSESQPVVVAGFVPSGVFEETRWWYEPPQGGAGSTRMLVEGRLSPLASELPLALLAGLYAQIVDRTNAQVLDAVGIRLTDDETGGRRSFSASPKLPRGWAADQVDVTLTLADPLERRHLRRERKREAQRLLANVADEHRLPGASFGAAATQPSTRDDLFSGSDTLVHEFNRRAPGRALEAEIIATGAGPDIPGMVDGLLATVDPALADRALDELILQADTWRSCGQLAQSVETMCAVLAQERGLDRLRDSDDAEPVLADLVWSAFRVGEPLLVAKAAALYERLAPPEDEGDGVDTQ